MPPIDGSELPQLSLFGLGVDMEIVRAGPGPIGLDASEYGAHSLRAGMVIPANAASVPDSAIMKRSRHKSVQTPARYVRHRDLFAFDPLARAL